MKVLKIIGRVIGYSTVVGFMTVVIGRTIDFFSTVYTAAEKINRKFW